MKKNTGFTLIELMIVVAIIAIIAAIAIPNLLRSRQSANEGAALGNVRTISTAEASYQAASLTMASGIGQYGSLADLSTPTNGAPFIDEVLGTGVKSGYTFTINVVTGNPPQFQCNANPNGSAGVKAYFVDESGVIRQAVGAAATATSPAVQ